MRPGALLAFYGQIAQLLAYPLALKPSPVDLGMEGRDPHISLAPPPTDRSNAPRVSASSWMQSGCQTHPAACTACPCLSERRAPSNGNLSSRSGRPLQAQRRGGSMHPPPRSRRQRPGSAPLAPLSLTSSLPRVVSCLCCLLARHTACAVLAWPPELALKPSPVDLGMEGLQSPVSPVPTAVPACRDDGAWSTSCLSEPPS